MTWPAVAALDKDTPVVIPIAALEQHGHHLPVFTDSLLVGEIIRRAEVELSDRVLFAPLMWLGNSAHHLDFAGTMSASPRVYIELLSDMVENFLTHGFRRIVVVNGHGGNNVPGDQALFEVRQRHRKRDDLLLLFACYWALGARPQEVDASIEQSSMGHACEWETSMILAIKPELVGDYRRAENIDQAGAFDPRIAPGSPRIAVPSATWAIPASPRRPRARRCSSCSPPTWSTCSSAWPRAMRER